jgi:toxin ParE1/3/4
MRLEITQAARQDMFFIQEKSIREFGQRQTDSFLDGLTRLFKLIARTPLMARERDEFSNPIRIHPYKSLIVAYRIENDVVKIIRVLFGRQDLKQLL